MIKSLSVLILAATLLASCTPRESYPRQSTTTTTTTTCPPGKQLQSDGMCRWMSSRPPLVDASAFSTQSTVGGADHDRNDRNA